jgi:hypothetical protein
MVNKSLQNNLHLLKELKNVATCNIQQQQENALAGSASLYGTGHAWQSRQSTGKRPNWIW